MNIEMLNIQLIITSMLCVVACICAGIQRGEIRRLTKKLKDFQVKYGPNLNGDPVGAIRFRPGDEDSRLLARLYDKYMLTNSQADIAEFVITCREIINANSILNSLTADIGWKFSYDEENLEFVMWNPNS